MNHQEKKSQENRNIEIEFVDGRESQNLSDDFKHLVEVVPVDMAVVLRHLHRRVPGSLLRDNVGEIGISSLVISLSGRSWKAGSMYLSISAAHVHIAPGKPPSVADGLLHVWTLVPDPPVSGV